MANFGWSYPPGCNSVPGDEDEGPCALCGKPIDTVKAEDGCQCPECPVCGEHGNPKCVEAGHYPDPYPELCLDWRGFARKAFGVEWDDKKDTRETIEKRLSRALYKSTDCGAWLSLYDDDWGRCGVKVGSIVEGSDADCETHVLEFPFETKAFWGAVDEIEAEASRMWKEANYNWFTVHDAAGKWLGLYVQTWDKETPEGDLRYALLSPDFEAVAAWIEGGGMEIHREGEPWFTIKKSERIVLRGKIYEVRRYEDFGI